MKIINELLVNDVHNALKFYTDNFGFEVCETTGNPINWVKLKKGNEGIMLEEYNCAKKEFLNFPPKKKSSNLIKFKQDTIEEVENIYKMIKKNKVTLVKDLHETDYGTTEFAVLDSDENILLISD